MNKLLVSFALVGLAFGTVLPAHAVDTPADADACYAMIDQLSTTAEEKNLSDDAVTEVLELLGTLEEHCQNEAFEEAASVGTELEGKLAQ